MFVRLDNNTTSKQLNDNSIAIGSQAGVEQGKMAIAIGHYAGHSQSNDYTIAIGPSAGQTNQGHNAVAIGHSSGYLNQGNNAVSILGGVTNQGQNAIAVGTGSAYTNQGSNAITIGFNSSSKNQAPNSISIGPNTSATGSESIVLGAGANDNGYSNCVVLNPSGNTGFNAVSSGGFFHGTMRQGSPSYVVGTTTNNELVWSPSNPSSDVRIKKNITDANTESLLTLLKQIKIRSFNFIDPNASKNTFGVIADELKTINGLGHQVVKNSEGYIPNIYKQLPILIETIDNVEYVKMYIETTMANQFKKGDYIRFFSYNNVFIETDMETANNEHQLPIIHVDEPNGKFIRVINSDKIPTTSRSIFLYGTYVTDLQTVNNENLVYLLVNATQNLLGKIDSVTEQQSKMFSANQILAKQVFDLQEKVTMLENNQLENTNVLKKVKAILQLTDKRSMYLTNM